MDELKVPGEIAIRAAIGNVCLQWSRLEMIVLGLICTIEPIDLEKGYIMFGGLDILPRVNMAINLARHNKYPPQILKRIIAVRDELQGGITDARNQVVHGAHKDMQGAETTLTMVRWKGNKRHKRTSAGEIATLAIQIRDIGNKVWAVMDEITSRAL